MSQAKLITLVAMLSACSNPGTTEPPEEASGDASASTDTTTPRTPRKPSVFADWSVHPVDWWSTDTRYHAEHNYPLDKGDFDASCSYVDGELNAFLVDRDHGFTFDIRDITGKSFFVTVEGKSGKHEGICEEYVYYSDWYDEDSDHDHVSFATRQCTMWDFTYQSDFSLDKILFLTVRLNNCHLG